jgi:hypothetical protein
MDVGVAEAPTIPEELEMQAITTIGLDIAKSLFQVHGIDAEGRVVIRRQLKRRYVLAFFERLEPCLIGIEACASAHHWSRQLQALGHAVRVMPPTLINRDVLCCSRPVQTSLASSGMAKCAKAPQGQAASLR